MAGETAKAASEVNSSKYKPSLPDAQNSSESTVRQPFQAHEQPAAENATHALSNVDRDGVARLASGHIVRLQRAVGNRAVGRVLAIQRSPLSDQLQGTLIAQGREAFFAELSGVRVSDADVHEFVERSLTGTDLRRARRILGTDLPLSDSQRNALFTQLVSRLGSAETFYSAACQQVHERIQAERAAAVELITALVTIGITYIAPGLGVAIAGLVNKIPASASVGTHAVALGIQSRAGVIASTIGEAGKRATPPVVRSSLASSPRDYLNALIEGFAAAKDQIVSDVATKIQDRNALPDEELWVYVANWDPTSRTIAEYASRISDLVERWGEQVRPIGPAEHGRRSTIEQDRPYTTQVGVVWVRHSSGDVLVQARVTDGRPTFRRFIDADLRDMVLARAATTQPRGVQEIPWGPPYIFALPASVPTTAARP